MAIPDIPHTRLEMYLDAIARNGGGGSGGGVLVVNATYDQEAGLFVCDKTWNDIHAAPMAVIVADMSSVSGLEVDIERFVVTDTRVIETHYVVGTITGAVGEGNYALIYGWVAETADGYPTFAP